MSIRLNANNLLIAVTSFAFIIIVALLKTNQLNTDIIIDPSPIASALASPAPSPAPSTPVSALATPTTAVTGPSVTSPSINAKVTSPLTVTGIVPAGWMFEGSFPLKLLDKQRKLIVQGIAQETVPGSWATGQPVSFTATLTFTTNEKSGFLVLEKDNPSGLPENDESYQLPVKFAN